MYDKKGNIKLETSATVHKKIDTDISFNQTDVGTSTLVFQITRNGKPLEINNNHVDATIFMTNGNPEEDNKAMYVYDKLEIRNPEAGLARYKIPDEFLSQIGKVKGQVYLLIKGKKDIVTEVEFSFRVRASLIDEIPSVDQFREIRSFSDLRKTIIKQVEEIKKDAGSIQNVIEDIKNERDNAIEDIGTSTNKSTIQLDNHTNELKTNLDDYKNEGINDIENRLKEQKSEVNENFSQQVSEFEVIKNDIKNLVGDSGRLVSEEETESWQKYKLTKDDGSYQNVLLEGSEENLHNLEPGYYYCTGIPIDMGQTSRAGFVLFRNGNENDPVHHIYFMPYNSSQIFLKRYFKNWGEWERVNDLLSDTGWKNLTLKNGVEPYDDFGRPRYRIFRQGDVTQVSIKGSVVNLTENKTVIAELPFNENMRQHHSYVQVTDLEDDKGTAMNRWSIEPNGEIKVLSLGNKDKVTKGTWHAVDTTFIK